MSQPQSPKTLGGTLFVRNSIEFDYNVVESIRCLQELCDEVVVLDAGSDDGTKELLIDLVDQHTTLISLDKSEWDAQHGREKLSYFTNIAIGCLGTDYNINLQADEIIHEDSFPAIRKAMQTGGEAFYCTRLNLWKDCNHVLNVPQERKPCSTEIIRLAKIKYKSVDDGESLSAPASTDFLNDIVIWHYGLVRKKEGVKKKNNNNLRNVFEIDHDPKLDKMDVFDWSAWFSESDMIEIPTSHPKFINEWIKTRP